MGIRVATVVVRGRVVKADVVEKQVF